MPAPFKRVTLAQFTDILERFLFTRKINAVHMHHTWRPNHKQFRGHDTIVSMWNHHTKNNGWSDIAQHITIDPEGFIWLGRNWNMPPASASGQNGNSKAGPFMFEMIGDFDVGQDPFAGEQRKTTLEVIARVQRCFNLEPGSLMFHNMMSGKTCPGSAIDYQQTVAAVRELHAKMKEQTGASRGMAPPFPPETYATRELVDAALADLTRPTGRVAESAEAEACTHQHEHDELPQTYRSGGAGTRAAALSPAQAQGLRPHLVNLTMGVLSSGGAWTTTREDIDAIFSEHLPQALAQARKKGAPLRLMIQAHGGLVNEAAGLAIAQKSVAWWKENGIYPIYFVWETGAFETIGQLLRGASTRDLFDHITDPVIETTARALRGPQIWGGMKLSAQLASMPDSDGGAWYVAQKLATFCKEHGDAVELHGVGHSAGSIFHAWFIPAALELGAPSFRSLHLMAPAARVDLFKEKLAGRIGAGQGVDKLTIYTMKEDLEKNDNCAKVYRKSLLYLIFHALEPQRKTPILGLEQSLREDPELSRLLGLDGSPGKGEVVWSRTTSTGGRSASTCATHGGFDDDAATMGSIARRILNRADHESITEYAAGMLGSRSHAWGEWEEAASAMPLPAPAPVPQDETPPYRQYEPGTQIHLDGSLQGNRRALCVGINAYEQAPLSGCLADVESWTRTLSGAGFSVTTLLDERATRAGIMESLERMIAASRRGDVLVFQFSGHGTQVKDLDGDEIDGDSPGMDEAICPYDYATGAFLIDDDIGRLFNQLPDGVNLTCFMDCCHSGTISRFGLVGSAKPVHAGANERMRYIPPSRALSAAHERYRQNIPSATATRAPDVMREVVFSACLSHEVAWESGGQGEFTVRATRILEEGFDNLTNTAFAARVSAAFGDTPRQHAKLYSSSEAGSRPLLQPLGAATVDDSVPPTPTAGAPLPLAGPQLTQLITLLEQLVAQGQLQIPAPSGNGIVLPAPASMQISPQQNR